MDSQPIAQVPLVILENVVLVTAKLLASQEIPIPKAALNATKLSAALPSMRQLDLSSTASMFLHAMDPPHSSSNDSALILIGICT